jgi:hypothetical protein
MQYADAWRCAAAIVLLANRARGGTEDMAPHPDDPFSIVTRLARELDPRCRLSLFACDDNGIAVVDV